MNEWRAFIECGAQRGKVAGLRVEFDATAPLDEVYAALELTERRLGARLPRSYRDFMLATSARGLLIGSDVNAFGPVSDPRTEMLGYSRGAYDYQLFSIAALFRFEETRTFAEPWVRDIAARNQRIDDQDYYRYGFDESGGALYQPPYFRPEYLADAVLLGGAHVEHTHVLLNSQARTSDGEWEVMEWSAADGGYLRFRSFAEYMRDTLVAYVEARDWSRPRPPSELAGTCAELLSLKPVARVGPKSGLGER